MLIRVHPWFEIPSAVFPLIGALTLKPQCRGTQGIGNVLIGRQKFEVLRSDAWEQVKGNLERGFRIVYERTSHSVILPELPVVGNQTQRLVAQAGHGSKTFHFAACKLRRLQDRALHDPAGVANEQGARFACPFHGQLHALNHAYNQKFGFPFIVAVRGHTRNSILELMERRLQNDSAEEMQQALQQIYQIALFRLQELIEENDSSEPRR